MQDLSDQVYGGDPISALCPSGQSGGNQVTDLSRAMTAPGGQPSTPYTSLQNETVDHPAPTVESQAHTRTVVEDGHSAGPRGGRPVLRSGGWNNFGGGDAPAGFRDHGRTA